MSNRDNDLSVGKIAIQSHTYPSPSSLYSANNAVDRNTDTCTRTRAIGYGAQLNVVFWVVDLGRVHNIYSIDILFKNDPGDEKIQRGRFAGYSLYISNKKL